MMSPLPASNWNYAAAAHLLSRAGFGGTPAEVEKLLALGLDGAVSYFLDYESIPDNFPAPEWAKPDPRRAEYQQQIQHLNQQERIAATDEEKTKFAAQRRDLQQQFQRDMALQLLQMRASWLERMATGPRPFQEKLALFWHGHFATSVVKVRETYFMWNQIETFRKLGCGNWLDLLTAVATDPAMLLWLDQFQSRKDHPNENFARESMELFTLGEGHYTEKDVTEAARAMTGWSLDRPNETYIYRPFAHDLGLKTVLGKTGRLTGEDVLQQIVVQPQANRFITGKLWKFFAQEQAEEPLLQALADCFHSSNQNFRPFLRAMFSSEEFYSDKVVASQIKSPVQWLIGSIRLLERPMPPPAVCVEMVSNLGQDLLAPPNVKGWDGGLSWITTNTLLSRYNQASILVMGQGNLMAAPGGQGQGQAMVAQRANQMARSMQPVNVRNLVTAEQRQNKDLLLAALEKRFLRAPLSEDHRQVLREYLAPREELRDDDLRHTIRLLLATTEYHPANPPRLSPHQCSGRRAHLDGPGLFGQHLFRPAHPGRRFRHPGRHRQGLLHPRHPPIGRRQRRFEHRCPLLQRLLSQSAPAHRCGPQNHPQNQR
jgi:uncharacterized protein (DUF1800 family)